MYFVLVHWPSDDEWGVAVSGIDTYEAAQKIMAEEYAYDHDEEVEFAIATLTAEELQGN